jgi:predicted nucleotidyltransferase
MSSLWEITPEKVQNAIKRIVEVSRPRKLILFGSYVSGNMHLNSDLDILVERFPINVSTTIVAATFRLRHFRSGKTGAATTYGL